MKPRILIVDDESSLLQLLDMVLEEEGYLTHCAPSVNAAKSALEEFNFDLVLCDIHMPDGDGLVLLKEIKEATPQCAVIMMTAYTSTDSAIEAMRSGAYDYLSKPFDIEEVKVQVQKALEQSALIAENLYLQKALESKHTFRNIIGKSRSMQRVFSLVERIARTNSTVLVTGESGTGKELIARAIHFEGHRARHPFLSINCGALPENLLESELFGHVRGAFTGAIKEKKGLFQEAHRGTLFLDEIGEMSPPMQVKLLRALQNKKIRKVGGTNEDSVDVRIIAATNRNLDEMIEEGTFREDLYYRINVIPIDIPPLRRRRDDIPPLVDHFLNTFKQDLGLSNKTMSQEAMQLLEDYHWPGNVRELENLIERTLTLSFNDMITSEDLPKQLTQSTTHRLQVADLPAEGMDLENHLDGLRKSFMAQALDRADGVQTRAAGLLKMSFRSFRYYAKKAGVVKSTGDTAEIEKAEL